MLNFVLGALVGGVVGFTIAALCVVAGRNDLDKQE